MKIRTDFVTNSSSSSFVAVTVTMKTGETYYASWNSGNINTDYEDPISLSKKQYLKLKSGAELMDLCYEHAKETSKTWYSKNHEEMEDFKGADKIRAITDFSHSVAFVKIESNLSIYEPVYEHTSRFNYYTGNCSEFEQIRDEYDWDEDEEDEDDGKIYYYGGITFEDDIYNPKIEKEIIKTIKSISQEELDYLSFIYKCDSSDDRAEIARKIYEQEARFLAGEEVGLPKLHDLKTYIKAIDRYLNRL